MDGEQDAHWRHALYVVGQVVLVGWFLGISFYFYHKQGYLLLIRKIGKGLFW